MPSLLQTITLTISLAALVSADACVVGGPADEVTQAKGCCHASKGEWRQTYPIQAICIVADGTKKEAASSTQPEAADASDVYTRCVQKIGEEPPINIRCIVGQNGLENGKTRRETLKLGRRG